MPDMSKPGTHVEELLETWRFKQIEQLLTRWLNKLEAKIADGGSVSFENSGGSVTFERVTLNGKYYEWWCNCGHKTKAEHKGLTPSDAKP